MKIRRGIIEKARTLLTEMPMIVEVCRCVVKGSGLPCIMASIVEVGVGGNVDIGVYSVMIEVSVVVGSSIGGEFVGDAPSSDAIVVVGIMLVGVANGIGASGGCCWGPEPFSPMPKPT